MVHWKWGDLNERQKALVLGNPTISPSNMESDIGNALLGSKKVTRFNIPIHIHIHSIRRELADTDGISSKALLDGFVKANVLSNDTTKEIKSITYSQEQTNSDEKTIVEIWEEVHE